MWNCLPDRIWTTMYHKLRRGLSDNLWARLSDNLPGWLPNHKWTASKFSKYSLPNWKVTWYKFLEISVSEKRITPYLSALDFWQWTWYFPSLKLWKCWRFQTWIFQTIACSCRNILVAQTKDFPGFLEALWVARKSLAQTT